LLDGTTGGRIAAIRPGALWALRAEAEGTVCMSETNRIDLVEKTLARIMAMVAAADAKVPPILAIDTAMLGVLAALVPSASQWAASHAAIAAVAGLLLLGSVGCLAASMFPRLSGPKSSLIYFAGIVSLERDAYVSALLGATPDKLLEDLARQCHRNAEIANDKFRLIRWAMIFLFVGIVPWLVSVALLYGAPGTTGGGR
jgi:hypothetical protein